MGILLDLDDVVSDNPQARQELEQLRSKIQVLEISCTNLEREREKIQIALDLILDSVDYTVGNCRVNEMIGAILPKKIIVLAHKAIESKGSGK